MNATNTLLDYMQDKRDDIKVIEVVNGSEREIFDERETLHMVDVKNLYDVSFKVMIICLIIFIITTIIIIITKKTKEKIFSLHKYLQ